MIKFAFRFCLVACAASIATQAWAKPMLPGQSALAVTEIDPLGGVVVAGPSASPLVGTAFTGTLTTTVIQGDASNPFGGLTFVYQVANSPHSADGIVRLPVTGYGNWLTDMSFQPGLGLPPTAMDRSLTGDVVGYSFVGPPVGPTVLLPGTVSELLIVQTDAAAWTTTTGNGIEGIISTGPIYVPTIPEPATLALLFGGLVLLLRRR